MKRKTSQIQSTPGTLRSWQKILGHSPQIIYILCIYIGISNFVLHHLLNILRRGVAKSIQGLYQKIHLKASKNKNKK